MTEPNGLTPRGRPKGPHNITSSVVSRDVRLGHGARLLFVSPTSNKPQGCAQDFRRSAAICRPHYAQDYVINRVVDFEHRQEAADS